MMAAAARELPVLDAACGAGRNAFVLAKLGCQVVCVDKDLRRLEEISKQLKRGPLAMLSKLVRLHPMDLTQDPWPFGAAEFGTIINVHFFLPGLLQHFETSLSPGGYLLVETPPGCGGNYRGLPKAGDVRQMLRPGFDIEHYREGRAGPVVSVKVVARKRKN
jgi:SAM-dependent methyltransferase